MWLKRDDVFTYFWLLLGDHLLDWRHNFALFGLLLGRALEILGLGHRFPRHFLLFRRFVWQVSLCHLGLCLSVCFHFGFAFN